MSFPPAWIFRVLSVLALGLCGQCIVYSSNPLVFAALAAVTAALFFLCRGSAIPIFILTAIGPIVNSTAFYCDPYVYNVEIMILTYGACFIWRNAQGPSLKQLDGISIAYSVIVVTLLLFTFIHCAFYGNYIPDEIRLVRVFLIGGLFLVFLKLSDENHSLPYYKTTLLTAFSVSSFGLIEFCVRGILAHNWGREPCSVFNGSEILAVYLCATLPFIVIGGAVLNNGVWPFLRGLTIPAAMVLLLTTRSRTGILALLVFLLFYGLRILRTQSRKKTTIIVAILFVTLGALATAGIKTFHGHAQGLGDLFVLLFSSRTQAWAEAIQAFMKAPITGSGAGVNVYNIFLQILCQYGTIGLATFLLFIIAVFINYSQIRKANPSDPLYKGLAWSAIVLLIAGIGESFMGNQLGYYTLFIFFLVGFNTKGINMSVEVTPK